MHAIKISFDFSEMYRLGHADDTLNMNMNMHRRLRFWEKHRFGVHPINRTRELLGEYHHLFQQLKGDREKFFQYIRMEERTFNIVLNAVTPYLEKQETNFKKPISAEERLVITLR